MRKTTSADTTWFPVFDSIKQVSSIGAVEVAPPDPNVIYVGSGDLITGGGINEGTAATALDAKLAALAASVKEIDAAAPAVTCP